MNIEDGQSEFANQNPHYAYLNSLNERPWDELVIESSERDALNDLDTATTGLDPLLGPHPTLTTSLLHSLRIGHILHQAGFLESPSSTPSLRFYAIPPHHCSHPTTEHAMTAIDHYVIEARINIAPSPAGDDETESTKIFSAHFDDMEEYVDGFTDKTAIHEHKRIWLYAAQERSANELHEPAYTTLANIGYVIVRSAGGLHTVFQASTELHDGVVASDVNAIGDTLDDDHYMDPNLKGTPRLLLTPLPHNEIRASLFKDMDLVIEAARETSEKNFDMIGKEVEAHVEAIKNPIKAQFLEIIRKQRASISKRAAQLPHNT